GLHSTSAFILEYIQHYLLTRTSERVAQKMRSAFVYAILSRDAINFDASTGELSNHIDRIKEGLGEKIGLFTRCFSTFVSC
ncbi:hypothetical protein PENTCL1PPCAC_5918, partial [Pristionchus entomophagus]